MSNPIEMLKKMFDGISSLTCDDDHEKVVRTIPIRKEWQKPFEKMIKVREETEEKLEELKSLLMKGETLKAGFWAKVEEDLDIFDAHMRFNTKTHEIEILAKEDEKEND